MWEANDKNTAFSFLFLLLKTREILIIPEYSSLILSSFVVRCPIWMGKVCIRGLKILKCEIAYWLKPFACRLNFSPLFLLQWNFWIWDSKTNQSIMKQLFLFCIWLVAGVTQEFYSKTKSNPLESQIALNNDSKFF